MIAPKHRPPVTLFLFWILVQVLYFPAWRSGFVTDFTGLLERFEGSSALGILTSFGFPAQQQVLNFFLYLFFQLFGTAPLPWHLVYTSLHAFNGFLFYRFHRELLRHFQVTHFEFIALGGALLFLACPYQSEPVIWKVSLNFLLSTTLILVALRQLLDWLAAGSRRFPWKVQVPFLLALFTFELAFTLPFLSLSLLLFWSYTYPERGRLGLRVLQVVMPQLAGLAGYFGLNRLMFGRWVGHYGAEVHLNLSPDLLLSAVLKYTVKLGGLARYYSHPLKEKIFTLLDQPAVAVAFALLLGSMVVWFLWRFSRLSSWQRSSGLLLLFYFIALGPVANIFFLYLQYVENDRYSYLSSGFFFTLIVLLISHLNHLPRYLVLTAFLVPNVLMLTRTVRYWQQSTEVYEGLQSSFRWHEAPAVYILNLPDNMRGVLLFRDYSGDGQTFLDALRYLQGRPYTGKLKEVASYNLTGPGDGVSVERLTTDTLKVTFNQWGNWWWRDGLGGSSYETEDYQFIDRDHHYLLVFKSLNPEAVFIYQDGREWKEFVE